MLSALTLLFIALTFPPPANLLPASDWITTGPDCSAFGAGDVDGDGFPDLLTINGNRDLCVAPSVHNWKAAGWRVLAPDLNPEALAISVQRSAETRRILILEADHVTIVPLDAEGKPGTRSSIPCAPAPRFVRFLPGDDALIDDGSGGFWRIDPAGALTAVEPPHSADSDTAYRLTAPPYELDARAIRQFTSTFSAAGGGGRFEWAVFACDAPHPHRVVRVAVSRSPDPLDADADGLTDAEEASLNTDPRDRDTDGDGLLDGWEVHGFPTDRLGSLGDRLALFDPAATGPDAGHRLSPRRRDVIVNVSYFEQVDRAQFDKEIPRIEAVYRALPITNPDGSTGVWLHIRPFDASVPASDQRLAWWDVGAKYFPRRERGLSHWLQVTPWGGGQSSETGDSGGCGNNWAVFAHELGHQLSLSHTGDSAPGWCPLYPSLMNYAYSYSFDGDPARPHFSSGEFRDALLDERHLREKLPFPYERVKFLANRPFRFSLKDNGDGTTLIDWNHNGAFDEGEVIADINYGGSTQAGDRKTHTLIGSAPSLATIAGRCFLAAAAHKQNAVTIKMHKGDEQWTAETELPSSSTRADPVLIGSTGADSGLLFVRRFDAWTFATVTPGAAPDAPPVVTPLKPLAPLPLCDLSALRIDGGRVLIIMRHDTGALEWCFLTGETPSELKPLKLTSMVPPGLAIDPSTSAITLVSAARHEKNGPFCMQVSSLRLEGDNVVEEAPSWSHGGKPCHCTSRPVPVFPNAGGKPQLTIFHTGWADGNGTWTGWRTTRVGNTSLDDGWLTSQLYDEWTRSRVALGFADSPDGAFYAFRWDPGDHRDWKINTMFVAEGGYGIDDQPMRDFNDAAKIGLWGIRHSILTMPTDADLK